MKCPNCRANTNTIYPVYNGSPECEICFEKDKIFSIYPCGHLFCSDCIRNYEEHNISDDDSSIELLDNNIELLSNNINSSDSIPENERKIYININDQIIIAEWTWIYLEWVLIECNFDGNKKPGFFCEGGLSIYPTAPNGWYAQWVDNNINTRRWKLVKEPEFAYRSYNFQGAKVHWRLDSIYFLVGIKKWILYEQNNTTQRWNRCTLGNYRIKPYVPRGWFAYWSNRYNVWILKINIRNTI